MDPFDRDLGVGVEGRAGLGIALRIARAVCSMSSGSDTPNALPSSELGHSSGKGVEGLIPELRPVLGGCPGELEKLLNSSMSGVRPVRAVFLGDGKVALFLRRVRPNPPAHGAMGRGRRTTGDDTGGTATAYGLLARSIGRGEFASEFVAGGGGAKAVCIAHDGILFGQLFDVAPLAAGLSAALQRWL